MSGGGGCGCRCGCYVYRAAPDEAGNGKFCVWIFSQPLHELRKSGRPLSPKFFSSRNFGCLDCLSFGCLDRLVDLLLDRNLSYLPSHPSRLLVFIVIVPPRGAVSGTDYTAILRRLVRRLSLLYVQRPVKRGVPRVLRRRLR